MWMFGVPVLDLDTLNLSREFLARWEAFVG